jgi:hypothetical protein
MSTEHFDAVNMASATLNQAKTRSWNTFAGLHDDALYIQPEVQRLGACLTVLHDIRTILREDPTAIDEVKPVLTALHPEIFNNISLTIMELNIAVANSVDTTDKEAGVIKHDIEGCLLKTSKAMRNMFTVFGIQSQSES